MLAGFRQPPPWARAALLVAALPLCCGTVLAGSDPSVPPVYHQSRIRTACPIIREALDNGIVRSTTLRELVEGLERSDVIVHLVPSTGASGAELRFATNAFGMRYLRVSVPRGKLQPQMTASIAHELQHATEIATSTSVVDEESMNRYFSVIGYAVGWRRYETDAARDAGRRVLRELATTRAASK